MERILSIKVNCGELTCASEPGVFCPMVRTSHYGQVWTCQLFEKGLEIGDDENSWTMRCPECLKAEIKQDEP